MRSKFLKNLMCSNSVAGPISNLVRHLAVFLLIVSFAMIFSIVYRSVLPFMACMKALDNMLKIKVETMRDKSPDVKPINISVKRDA